MSTDYQGNTTYIGDTTFGVTRPNYVSNTGVENITSNMEFYTISTAVDIRTAAQTGGSPQSQYNLNKLLEIVSLRGQPIIMGAVGGAGPFTITLVSEHAGGWGSTATTGVLADPRSGEDLHSRIVADGVNYGFGITANGVNDTAMSVTFNSPQVLT